MSMNLEVFGKQYPSLELGPRDKSMFEKILKPGDSVLDIGGAAGRYLESINRFIPIKGTVLDSDLDSIEYGCKTYPHIEFIHAEFLNDTQRMMPGICYYLTLPSNHFDVVIINALFPHLNDWKLALREMARIARKYICVQSLIRLDGPTIDDIDTSYFYYLDTGKRVKQVIINLWEFINFLCLEEIKAKHIWFDGHITFDNEDKDSIIAASKELEERRRPIRDGMVCAFIPHAFRGIADYEIYNDTWVVELWDEKENPKRMGGIGPFRDAPEGYVFYMPDIDIHIDGSIYHVVRDGKKYWNISPILKTFAMEREIYDEIIKKTEG